LPVPEPTTSNRPLTAFLSIGFRPFYLGAAAFAALAVPLWVAARLSAATGVPDYAWHQHEMVFGFAPAVIAGFLLTAVRNWTGLPTPSGMVLAALVSIWLLARITPLLGSTSLTALVDLSFLPLLAVALAIPLWRARNLRNAFVILVLLALWTCDAVFTAALHGVVAPRFAPVATTVAADVLMLLMTVIAGRIIPNFSANALAALAPRSWPALERLVIGATVAIAMLDGVGSIGGRADTTAFQALLVATAAVHLLRLSGWQPWKTTSNPLLFVLPASYLWIPIHLLLRVVGGDAAGSIDPAAAHALFVGAMAGLMLSMMTRSSLGHTGRPLVATPIEFTCFICIHAAALVRVFGPLLDPEHYATWLIVSATSWSIAFGAFAAGYARLLTKPRADAVSTSDIAE
jgi:uncharacterized protein involved in response to NO